MLTHETSILNQLAHDRAENAAASRFFNNETVELEALIDAARAHAAKACAGRHVLAIQDTTEINYASHSGLLKANDPDLGPVGNNRDVGFFLHPSLALDAETGLALGFADLHLWNRRWDKSDKYARNYAQQPIEEKESYRWIEASRRSQRALREARRVTVMADREGDIYEELVLIPDEHTDVLIRSRSDRRLADAEEAAAAGTLYAKLEEAPCAGTYEIEVSANNGRRARTARLQVRFREVSIAKPTSNRHAASLPDRAALYAVEAREDAETVPEREDPIRWRLLTTHAVRTFDEAREVISYYSKRPQIEQVFRLLKQQGFQLQRSQLERGAALKKLCVLSVGVVLMVMKLVSGRAGREVGAEPAALVFTERTQAFMKHLQNKLERATRKQQCPHEAGTLAWGSWIVGRLGGWNGYARGAPPGPLTMKRGLERLASQFAGWQLAQA